MKKILLPLLCLPLFSIAQKLKISINKFSGDTTYYTSLEPLTGHPGNFAKNGNSLDFQLVKAKNEYVLLLLATTMNYKSITVSKGQKLYIKTGNSIDALFAPRDEFSGRDERQNTTIALAYELNYADVDKLKNSKITLIRLEAERRFLEYDVKDKESDAIAIAFHLLLLH